MWKNNQKNNENFRKKASIKSNDYYHFKNSMELYQGQYYNKVQLLYFKKEQSIHKMGNQCGKPQEATAQDKRQIDNNNKLCCCFGLFDSPQLKPQQDSKKIQNPKICPIQFTDNEGQIQKYTYKSQIKNENESQEQPATADRLFVRTASANQEESQNQKSNNKENSSISQDQSNQASTKRDPEDQKPVNLIIRAKNTNPISQFYNGKQSRLSKMEIPFEVIKLSLHNHILSALKLYYEDFFEKFDSKTSPRAYNWRMLENGTYTNILDNLHGVFITKDLFYQGFFIKNSKNSYSPDQKGFFINRQYVYIGQFKAGKPNGKGKLINRQHQQLFQGDWFEGSFIKGSLRKPNIIYNGQFYNNQASGIGQLHLTNFNAIYKGKFSEGQFLDDQGRYQCQNYWYFGGFRQGKKYGKGVLFDKQTKIKYEGNWINDRIKAPLATYNTQQS